MDKLGLPAKILSGAPFDMDRVRTGTCSCMGVCSGAPKSVFSRVERKEEKEVLLVGAWWASIPNRPPTKKSLLSFPLPYLPPREPQIGGLKGPWFWPQVLAQISGNGFRGEGSHASIRKTRLACDWRGGKRGMVPKQKMSRPRWRRTAPDHFKLY